jgi:hypothetical protein
VGAGLQLVDELFKEIDQSPKVLKAILREIAVQPVKCRLAVPSSSLPALNLPSKMERAVHPIISLPNVSRVSAPPSPVNTSAGNRPSTTDAMLAA